MPERKFVYLIKAEDAKAADALSLFILEHRQSLATTFRDGLAEEIVFEQESCIGSIIKLDLAAGIFFAYPFSQQMAKERVQGDLLYSLAFEGVEFHFKHRTSSCATFRLIDESKHELFWKLVWDFAIIYIQTLRQLS